MNINIENQSNNEKKLKIFYITIIAICVISIIAAFVIQIVNDNKLPSSGNTEIPQVTDDKLSKYKESFNRIFENKVNYLENNSYKITKVNKEKEIVYLGYQNKQYRVNDYELDVNIPYINIKNETVQEFNIQIRDTFEQKVKSVLNSKNNNVIYSVDYSDEQKN